MKVYMETNFILELVLRQEEDTAAIELLELAEAGSVKLRIPTASLIEAGAVCQHRNADRDRFDRVVAAFDMQGRRSGHLRDATLAVDKSLSSFADAVRREASVLDEVANRLSLLNAFIDLNAGMISRAMFRTGVQDLRMRDAVILEAVLSDLSREVRDDSFFVSRDADFSEHDVRSELLALGCVQVSTFKTALAKIHPRLGNEGGA